MTFHDLIKQAINGVTSFNDFIEHSKYQNISIEEAFNSLSLYFAKEFIQKRLVFSVADFAMNDIWHSMLEYITEKNEELIEPCYSIYCAFDAGEYETENHKNPIENITIPELNRILKNA